MYSLVLCSRYVTFSSVSSRIAAESRHAWFRRSVSFCFVLPLCPVTVSSALPLRSAQSRSASYCRSVDVQFSSAAESRGVMSYRSVLFRPALFCRCVGLSSVTSGSAAVLSFVVPLRVVLCYVAAASGGDRRGRAVAYGLVPFRRSMLLRLVPSCRSIP